MPSPRPSGSRRTATAPGGCWSSGWSCPGCTGTCDGSRASGGGPTGPTLRRRQSWPCLPRSTRRIAPRPATPPRTWGTLPTLKRPSAQPTRGQSGQVCHLPGRFSVPVGADDAGKATLTDALYLAHHGAVHEAGARTAYPPVRTGGYGEPGAITSVRSRVCGSGMSVTRLLGRGRRAEGRCSYTAHTVRGRGCAAPARRRAECGARFLEPVPPLED